MISEISNHVSQAVARLIQQYKDKPRIAGLVEALTQEMQDLETAIQDLNSERSVDTADGLLLDRIGVIVGQDRPAGMTDDDYRILIKSKIGQNISQGEPERIIETFKVLKMASVVLLQELYPAAVSVQGDVTFADQSEVNMIILILERVVAAGVRIEGITIFDADDAFSFQGTLAGRGFGSTTDPLAGGKFATIKNFLLPFAFEGSNPSNRGFGTVLDPLIGGGFESAV